MKKRIIAAVLAGMLIVSAGGCGNGTASSGNAVDNSNGMATESSADQAIASARQDENADADTKEGGVTALSLMQEVNTGDEQIIDDNYRTWYEVFVYSFFDSDGDGIGDLNGLTEKLDYINDGDPATDTDLGCNGIWLMPVMPSTTYHKYDVTDYCDIDPEYGTMDDFKNLIAACHERGINVIIDLVMNHTSSQHEWFKTAADYLKNREYRYLSPVIQIQRNTRRAVELHSAALTNTPAIDAMSPIACTDKPNEGEGSAEQENIEDGSKGTLAELAALLQLDPSATIEDVYQAVAALLEGQEALKLKADAYQFEIARTKADGVVLEAMKAGKILPFQRDWAFQSAMDDMDSFNLWLKTAPQVVPMGEVCPENLSQTQRHRSRAHELMGLSTEDITKYGNV